LGSIKSKGIQAFIWDLLGKIGIHASSFIVMIFLARLLEPSDFGLIAMVMVIVSIATIFSDIGLGGALIQRRRVIQIHYSSVFLFNIGAGFTLTLITLFSADWIANFYNNMELIPIIKVMSSLFIISSFHAVQSVILRKELNYKKLTQVALIASISSGIIGVGLAFWGMGVWSLVVQVISREIITNIVIWTTSAWKPSISFSFKALKQLWGYGFHMFLAGVIDTIYERIDYMIIGKLFSSATLGFFHQAKQLNMFVIKYSSGSLMSVLFPLLSKIQKDTIYFKKVVIKSLGIICFVTFFLLGELYIMADGLIIGLFGAKWVASIYYFKILALSGFAYPISALMVNILSSRGKSKDFLKLEVYKKIIQSINLYILYLYGIEVFLYGLIVTSILGTSLNIKFATDEIGLLFIDVIKPILIQTSITVALISSITYITDYIYLDTFLIMLIKGISFMIAYIFINYIFKIKSFQYIKEQIRLIRKVRKR
jgi:O-antigen/teichoic acid export membrane protein